jgi:hypothetical protein
MPMTNEGEIVCARGPLVDAITAFLAHEHASQMREIRATLERAIDEAGPDAIGSMAVRLSAAGADWSYYPRDPLARRIGLQIEVLFSAKGAKLYDAQEDITGRVLLRYVDIPTLIRVNGPRNASRAFHMFGGPYTGFRMNATREISFVANSITNGSKMDMSSEVERVEFGWLGGAGLDIGQYLVIDGRYGQALTSLNTDRRDGVRIKNRVFVVMAGVRF